MLFFRSPRGGVVSSVRSLRATFALITSSSATPASADGTATRVQPLNQHQQYLSSVSSQVVIPNLRARARASPFACPLQKVGWYCYHQVRRYSTEGITTSSSSSSLYSADELWVGENTYLWVGNLPTSYTAARLQRELLQGLQAKELTVLPHTPSESQAVIGFTTSEDAQKAFHALQGKSELIVHYAIPKNSEGRNLWVGNIPAEVTLAEVRQLFQSVGVVICCRMLRTTTTTPGQELLGQGKSHPKKAAMVLLKEAKDAELAKSKLGGYTFPASNEGLLIRSARPKGSSSKPPSPSSASLARPAAVPQESSKTTSASSASSPLPQQAEQAQSLAQSLAQRLIQTMAA